MRFGSAPAVRVPLRVFYSGASLLRSTRPSSIIPILRLRLGDCFRLDRLYGMCMNQGMQRGDLHADFGASSITSALAAPGERYDLPENRMLHGLIAVAWNLADAGPESVAVAFPAAIRAATRRRSESKTTLRIYPQIVIPPAPAGSVIIFTEALTHGIQCSAVHISAAPYFYKTASRTWCGSTIASKRPRISS